ncbi:hypothetical protein K469DRAFT_80265 [Zopfia rhizophila CBS 207.26]|uniref:Uncharacterized protein n=1 Tax=Zopfia rhizophila CBS 207.26 TaxID=1314779 RepID=A0A6A6DB03_9PEZI|nr:hypothetical protein K469DRAFT_80265 [Zopfia rhizophila CBS 207.26]
MRVRSVKPRTKRRLSWAASTSLAYRPRSIHALETMSAEELLLSSPGTRICDQRHLESAPALGSSTKPTSNLRSAVEPCTGWWGGASGRRRGPESQLVRRDESTRTPPTWSGKCPKLVINRI